MENSIPEIQEPILERATFEFSQDNRSENITKIESILLIFIKIIFKNYGCMVRNSS